MPASAFGTMKVVGTSISEIDPSHLRVAVDLSVTPSRSATLSGVRLTSLKLNGLPVYAEPLNEEIVLVKEKPVALPPLYVTVQLRDVTSVEPLREMIEKEVVHVQGHMVADVKLGFLEKLVMHTEHPRVSLSLASDVPVSIGSGPFEKTAALAILTVVDFGFKTGIVQEGLSTLESPWQRDLEKLAKTNLMEVESSYSLKEKDSSYPVSLDQLGFKLKSGVVITTAEVKEPWAYDTEFLGRIKSGEAKLVKNSGEILLFAPSSRSSSGIADAYSLTHKDFKLSERGDKGKEAVITEAADLKDDKVDLTKVKIRPRNAPGSLSVITFAGKAPAGGFDVAPASVTAQDSWTKVAVYRLVSDSQTGKDTVDVVVLPARRDGKSIHFERPVDSSFFGSPILVPEGVLGVVQDEETGAFLPEDVVKAAGAKSGTV